MALNRAGKTLCGEAMPQDEIKIRGILVGLTAHGKILVAANQPVTIGTLPVAVEQATGAAGWLPAGAGDAQNHGPAPGPAKIDARDAAIIAEAAQSMPHTLWSEELDDETPGPAHGALRVR